MESIDGNVYRKDIDDTDEHVLLGDPSLATKLVHRFFGRAIYRIKTARIAFNSDRQATHEARLEGEVQEWAFGPEGQDMDIHTDAIQVTRREQLYEQGMTRLRDTTINNQLGSTKFLGELMIGLDD